MPWQQMDWELSGLEAGIGDVAGNLAVVTALTAGEKAGSGTLSPPGGTSNPCPRVKVVAHYWSSQS